MRAKLALILFLSVAVLNAGGKRKFAAGPGIEGDSVAISNGCASSAKPFYFSADVAEGNHLVTVTLGAQVGGPSETTIKAELRRLMAESVRVEAGQRRKVSFAVNVRRTRIAGTGLDVILKEREKTFEATALDNRLTLEFTGATPTVCAITIQPLPRVPTLFIAGDSTSTDQPREPFSSWGQMLTRFFKPSIAVANHGESGESLKSFLRARRWDKLLDVARPGDWLMIQMGHNDQKERGEGIGAFSSYRADLERFVDEARAKGMHPVLVTSMHRRTFDASGKITNSLGDYPEAVRRVAAERKVPLIDLHAMSAKVYEAFGPEPSVQLFSSARDGTHHNNYGSYQLAKCIVEAIRVAHLPLAKYLIEVTPYDPAHPDAIEAFHLPPSPSLRAATPDGN